MAQRRAIEALLADAVDTGELRPGTDVAVVAGSVQAITVGAGLAWAIERQGSLAERLRHELGATLSPHITPGRGPGGPGPADHEHPAQREEA